MFAGVKDYIAKHCEQMAFATLENVVKLSSPPRVGGRIVGPSNLDVVVQRLWTEARCRTHVWALSPVYFGVPQCRDRLWLQVFPEAELRRSSLHWPDAPLYLKDVMDRLVGGPKQSLGKYLLPESHPLVRKYFRELGAGKFRDDALAERKPKRLKWVDVHRAHAAFKGIEWANLGVFDDATFDAFPGLTAFSPRQLEIIQLSGITIPTILDAADRRCKTLEVRQSLGWSKPRVDEVACLVPKNMYYLSHRCRELVAGEKLQLQSIFWPPRETARLSGFPESLLSDLAGNAFECSCMAAVVFSACMLLAQACQPALPSAMAESAPMDSDSD